ncbi:hypothetical protein [Pandoravirus japonicus]|uniref:Uncharacterized protein n=1 Tax=Pandoravirus japonicus TaxID=2823154 RepID=A0A811BNA1_9VIRU|nr:hypothetical protein [Pandoravirus japonicus]
MNFARARQGGFLFPRLSIETPRVGARGAVLVCRHGGSVRARALCRALCRRLAFEAFFILIVDKQYSLIPFFPVSLTEGTGRDKKTQRIGSMREKRKKGKKNAEEKGRHRPHRRTRHGNEEK